MTLSLQPSAFSLKKMTTLLKDLGQTFIPANPEPGKSYAQIPKHNQRFIELKSELTEERTIELSVSSDLPHLRWFGYEELDHTEGAVDLSRFNDGANVLFNHNRDDYIGIIQKAWLDGGRLYNRILFDTHELAEKIYQSIKAGIVRNVSIGYEINQLKLVEQRDNIDVYRAIKWTPFETSIVTVPADASVGVRRSYFVCEGERASLAADSSPRRGQRAEGRRDTADLEQYEGDLLNKTSAVCLNTSAFVGENSESKVIEAKEMPEEPVVINEADIRQQERDRVGGINALIAKHGHRELGQKAIDGGYSIEAARSAYLDKVTQVAAAPVAKTLAPVEMSRGERKQYSFLRAIGYASGRVSADKAGLELEVSRELENRIGKPPEGIYVDQSQLVSYRAPYDTNTPAAAGNLISTDLLSDRFIEQLYNQSAFLSMGVTYLRDLQGNVEIPRESTFTKGYWVGEGLPITEDEGTFDKINLSPKKLACLTKMTYEMVNQSSVDIESYARARLIRGLALELDRTIGFGSGIGEEPLGIVSHPEVLSIVLGANGGALSWSALVDLIAQVDQANALGGGNFGYVVNAKTKAKLMKTLDDPTTGAGSWIWQNNNATEASIAGYRAYCSNQIPNNLSKGTANNLTAIFFGDFSNVMLGIWSGLDIMVDPYTESSNAIIKVVAKQLVDLELTRGKFFAVATDVQNN